VAAHVTIQLDTTGPQSPAVVLNGGDPATVSRDVSAAITSADADAVMVKIYGDVDDAHAPGSYRADEADAPWITLASPHSIRLSTGDGAKTVKIKLRDDVLNVSAEATDAINLDTSAPTIVVDDGPDPAKISKQATADESEIVWHPDTDIVEYKVKVVSASGSAHNTGTQVPTTAGSDNVGAVVAIDADEPITTTINGTDLETASAGDGDKIVKVFGKDAAGNWSV
jgi:hypothetical protein